MRTARLSFVLFGPALLVAALTPSAHAQWGDEFNGSGAPSTGNWTRDLGGGGWGNNELQCYTDGSANANQTGGYLNIQARIQGSCDGRGYSSARIKTQNVRNFGPYGRIEARLQGPMGQGLWPAFWTLGSNITSVPWPGCGEIDIMEHINTQGNTHGVIHWNGPAGYAYYTAAMPAVNFTAWNNYAIDWNSSRIQWQVNGAAVGEANIAGNINSTEEFHRSMFIILNLAVGGNWPGAPNSAAVFPANYNIDWVRVNGGGAVATPTPTTAPRATATPTTAPRTRATATATARARATATPTTPPSGGCAAAWSCSTVYQVGAVASYNGVNYRLNWGPRGGQCPGFNPSLDNWWISQGSC
jgi:beta-glucanase (GH16 family)